MEPTKSELLQKARRMLSKNATFESFSAKEMSFFESVIVRCALPKLDGLSPTEKAVLWELTDLVNDYNCRTTCFGNTTPHQVETMIAGGFTEADAWGIWRKGKQHRDFGGVL